MTQSITFSSCAARLREFIQQSAGGAQKFNELALELFGLQFAANQPYARFCQSRKATPATVRHWVDIPAMPTAGFKELELTSIPSAERTRVFYSSGTTEQRPSRHFHNAESLAIYEASLLPWFKAHLMSEQINFIALTPPPEKAPHSSLVHMFETVGRELNSQKIDFTGTVGNDGAWGLDEEKTVQMLTAANQPVMLLGTAFSFVHLVDALAERKLAMRLPEGSRVLETGGYKGRSRTMPKTELHTLITRWLGVETSRIVCEYGMSELSSQAYDKAMRSAERIFRFPPWAKVQIISPETGKEVGEGETGLIRVFDLANVRSVMAIQTEDLGVRRGDGFELIGRAALSEPRGCSLMSI
ncbi:MAG: putative acyl protein synthase/acyl-CoA reductase-like protein [Pedosphaera sp.]|nr:putative acyl protein synthase/acyl-CoA reductase-like protein [Pedosphaera sp.]